MKNRLLAAAKNLDPAAVQIDEMQLDSRRLIYDVDQPMSHAWFPIDCVISLVNLTSDGTAVETATVGNEGFVGLPLFLDAERISAQAFCQIPGHAARIPAEHFKRLVDDSPSFSRLIARYTQALFTQVSQSSACNRIHPVRQRCIRWLLQTHDRVGRDEFELTHLFLSQMLGVRRATVTEVARDLQREGLIRYVYGHMTITDRDGLERASCECYAIIAAEFARLIEGRDVRGPLAGLRASEDERSIAGAPAGD
jgi:CRP-like cAMP-binding protein